MNRQDRLDLAAASAQLQQAAAGLLYRTETDAPFEFVLYPKGTQRPSSDDVRAVSGLGSEAPVREVTIADFFDQPAREQDWHGPNEKQVVQRYRRLAEIFATGLTESFVYRLGSIEFHVLLLGRTSDGHWVGLKSRGVET